jgi:hypothetical protein
MEDLAAYFKKCAVEDMEYFLRLFATVPDDKLNWSPTPTSKSAMRIAAHTALYAGRFARMIRERELPGSGNLAERKAKQKADEIAITTREEVESIFRKGTAEVVAALDTVPPEDFGKSLDSGFGWSMPMLMLMAMPSSHVSSHTGQINYLQTCWDDQEVHF